MALPQNAALILVDVQQGHDVRARSAARNNPDAEHNIARLLDHWRADGRPLFHIQHHSTEPDSPLRPDRPGVAFKPEAQPLPGEPVIQKSVNSAFIGTDLAERLQELAIGTVVICGLVTPHCVSTTARMAANLGFQTYVVDDATAAFDVIAHTGERLPAEQVHRVALANLHDEFATIARTRDLIPQADDRH